MGHTRALGSHPAYPLRGRVNTIEWATNDPSYAPIDFTHEAVLQNARTSKTPWADQPNVSPTILKTRITKKMTRYGKLRAMTLETAGCWNARKRRPRNPVGRTGMVQRGLLGKWGPNHAADPIVTRLRPGTGILEVAVVKRRDTGEHALPGGMCEDKRVADTLLAEFLEEALATQEGNPALTTDLVEQVKQLFSAGGRLIYAGYVDDPRNTDEAWMESTVYHFHINDPTLAAALPLMGGDDACDAKWIPVTPNMTLYASHADWMSKVQAHMSRRMSMRPRA